MMAFTRGFFAMNKTSLFGALIGAGLLVGCESDGGQDLGTVPPEDLVYQSVSYDQGTVASAPPPVAPQTAAPAGDTYTIRKGDTLWSIATRYYNDGKRWKDIVSINPGLDPTKLRVGQQIVLPSLSTAIR
jgi:LysM repeat protein